MDTSESTEKEYQHLFSIALQESLSTKREMPSTKKEDVIDTHKCFLVCNFHGTEHSDQWLACFD